MALFRSTLKEATAKKEMAEGMYKELSVSEGGRIHGFIVDAPLLFSPSVE